MKYIIPFILILLVLSDFLWSQEDERPKIGLVLSGGGAKGFAHIGVLKVLEEEKIPVDIIVGTSIGSIVGGLYSIGYSANEIEEMAQTEDWDKLLSDNINRMQLSTNSKIEKQRFIGSMPLNDSYKLTVPQGVINGQNILNLFCRLTQNVPADADFSKFPVNYACIGMDMETGNEIVINSGFLPTAIYSSMSIPGVFFPVEHNGYRMLDGGLVNNFPTDVAKKMGADIIIGVDIRNDLYSYEEIISIQQLMDQLINFYALSKDSVNKSLCDIMIRPEIEGFNAYSFTAKAVDTLVQRGIASADLKIEEIRALKTKYNLPDPDYSTEYKMNEIWNIDNINITGDYSINEKFIRNTLDLDTPDTYTPDDILNSIERLYGLGSFKRIYFNINQSDKENNLNLILEEQPYKNINFGMRVNTTDAVSILFNFTQKDYRRFIGMVSVTADICSNPELIIQTELSKGKLPVFGLQLDGKFSKYNVFLNERKAYTSEIYYAQAKAYTYKNIKNSSLFGLGAKVELYKGNIFNSTVDTLFNLASNEIAITSLYTYFSADNLDDYYFPTNGIELNAEFSLASDENYTSINPIAILKNRNIIKLARHTSFLMNLYGRALITHNVHEFQQTYAGGTEYSTYFAYHLPFYGMPSLSPTNRYTFVGLVGLRFEVLRNHYISLYGNCLFENEDISPVDDFNSILGTAVSYSINSGFGPLDFTLGYSDSYKKLTISANAGFWF